jgi:hypothetical protein
MPSSKHTYDPAPAPPSQGVKEEHVEYGFIGKARAQAETALMADLAPLLRRRAQGREISGLSAYE